MNRPWTKIKALHAKTSAVLRVLVCQWREGETNWQSSCSYMKIHRNELGLSVVNCLQNLLKLFVQQSNHMKFFKVLSYKLKVQICEYYKPLKHVSLQTIHSGRLALSSSKILLRHLRLIRKLQAEKKKKLTLKHHLILTSNSFYICNSL